MDELNSVVDPETEQEALNALAEKRARDLGNLAFHVPSEAYPVSDELSRGERLALIEAGLLSKSWVGPEKTTTHATVTFPRPALALRAAAYLADHNVWFPAAKRLARLASQAIPKETNRQEDYPTERVPVRKET